jgi:hypothetical protein
LNFSKEFLLRAAEENMLDGFRLGLAGRAKARVLIYIYGASLSLLITGKSGHITKHLHNMNL